MDALPPQISRTAAVNWLGPGGHALHYPVRRGALMNIVAFIERDDWQVESWTERGTHDELARDFSRLARRPARNPRPHRSSRSNGR